MTYKALMYFKHGNKNYKPGDIIFDPEFKNADALVNSRRLEYIEDNTFAYRVVRPFKCLDKEYKIRDIVTEYSDLGPNAKLLLEQNFVKRMTNFKGFCDYTRSDGTRCKHLAGAYTNHVGVGKCAHHEKLINKEVG